MALNLRSSRPGIATLNQNSCEREAPNRSAKGTTGSLSSRRRSTLVAAATLREPSSMVIVDFERFDGPNTARHVLGLKGARQSKAVALAKRLTEDIPGIDVSGYFQRVSTWVTTKCEPGMYDLVVDCTAESTVRTLLSRWRAMAFGDSPLVHAWVEPFCAAAHVVLTQSDYDAAVLCHTGEQSARPRAFLRARGCRKLGGLRKAGSVCFRGS